MHEMDRRVMTRPKHRPVSEAFARAERKAERNRAGDHAGRADRIEKAKADLAADVDFYRERG